MNVELQYQTFELQDKNGQFFSEWQHRLIKSADEDEKKAHQREFIDAIDEGPLSLTSYLKKELRLDTLPQIPSLHRPLSAGEAFTPPDYVEIELWKHWNNTDLPLIFPREASLPIFWYGAYITWIETEQLGENLRATLITSKKSLDAETRTALRNLGGLPEARGNVSVFSDCPLARAWWRCYIAEDAVNYSTGRLNFTQAHSALYKKSSRGEYSNDRWESFVLNSLRRITSLCDSRVRAAIVAYLATQDSSNSKASISTDKQYSSFAKGVARRIRSFSPQLLSWESLQEIIEESAESASESDTD